MTKGASGRTLLSGMARRVVALPELAGFIQGEKARLEKETGRKWTWAELSRLTGIPDGTIRGWAKGKHQPQADSDLIRFAQKIGTPPERLFSLLGYKIQDYRPEPVAARERGPTYRPETESVEVFLMEFRDSLAKEIEERVVSALAPGHREVKELVLTQFVWMRESLELLREIRDLLKGKAAD